MFMDLVASDFENLFTRIVFHQLFVRKFVRVRKNVRKMINVKFYLDKADKSKSSGLYLFSSPRKAGSEDP